MKQILMQLWVFYWRVRRYIQDHRVADRPRYEKFRFRFYEELWRKTAKTINKPIEDFGHGYFKIGDEKAATFVLEAKVQLDDHLSLRMAGNKPLVHKILSDGNFPVQDYCEYSMTSLQKAFDFMQKKGGSCVIKPAAGSGAGNGVVTKITDYKRLRKASLWAATFSQRLLIEEEIPGDSYRLLYLNGKFLDAVRRDPPHVTGDGKHTIAELMLQENADRLKGDTIKALSPLVVDYEAKLDLQKQGKKLSDRPAKGEKIRVKTVCNQNRYTENESITKTVHPSIIEAGERIADIFSLQLLGVDLITPDVTRPLKDVGGVINEINTNPGLHHHYLVKNPDADVDIAGSIIQFILNGKKNVS